MNRLLGITSRLQLWLYGWPDKKRPAFMIRAGDALSEWSFRVWDGRR